MSEIMSRVVGNIGHIALNRPGSLNALTLNMVREMTRVLLDWETDTQIAAVVVSGNGDRAFCAGGDLKGLYEARQQADCFVPGAPGSLLADMFREEYALDYLISDYAKPYVALLDGVTMGAGFGISISASHRIVTERTVFAMPETKIGLFPDVGASYFLPRLGPIGRLLGLTGHTIQYAACLQLGIGTHFVRSADTDQLVEQFANLGVNDALYQFPQLQMHCEELIQLQTIASTCFTSDSADEIEACLESACDQAESADFPAELLTAWRAGSPTSRALTCEQLRRSAGQSLAECLQMEYRLTQFCMSRSDFFEGVRAALIDRDKCPTWNPATLAAVSPAAIDAAFESLGDRDLDLSPITNRSIGRKRDQES